MNNKTVSDSVNKHIKIRTLNNGEQSFLLYYRRNKKTHMMKIASSGTSIKKVREIATYFESEMIKDKSFDPLIERINNKKEIAFDDLFNNYLKSIIKAKSYNKIVQLYKNRIQQEIGHKDINKIKRADIVELKREISKKTPYVANSVLTYIHSAFEFALEEDLVEYNPCSKIKKHEDIKRDRILSTVELQRVFEVLKEKEINKNNAPSIAFIKLLIFTGARVSEIANIRWKHIKNDVIRLSEHKTDHLGHDKKIYLTNHTLAIINSLKRINENDKVLGIKSPRHLWDSIKKQADIEDVRLHDLRHSYISFGINTRAASLDEMQAIVGHKDIKSTQRYLTRSVESNLANAQAVSNQILNTIKGNQNV